MKLSFFFILLISFTLFSSINKKNQYNFDKLVIFKNGNQNNAYLFSTLNKNYYFSFTDENSGNLYENSQINKRCLRLSFENKDIILNEDFSEICFNKNITFRKFDFIEEIEMLNDSVKITSLYALKKKNKKGKVFEIYSDINEKIYINQNFLDSYTHGYFRNTDFKSEFQLPFKIIHYHLYTNDIDTINRIKYKEVNTFFNY
ncbi:MAG: hypothetical protein ACOVQ2_03340 [Flavobacterium sp.]